MRSRAKLSFRATRSSTLRNRLPLSSSSSAKKSPFDSMLIETLTTICVVVFTWGRTAAGLSVIAASKVADCDGEAAPSSADDGEWDKKRKKNEARAKKNVTFFLVRAHFLLNIQGSINSEILGFGLDLDRCQTFAEFLRDDHFKRTRFTVQNIPAGDLLGEHLLPVYGLAAERHGQHFKMDVAGVLDGR